MRCAKFVEVLLVMQFGDMAHSVGDGSLEAVAISTETLVTVLVSLLGLGGLRTVEKFGGKAR